MPERSFTPKYNEEFLLSSCYSLVSLLTMKLQESGDGGKSEGSTCLRSESMKRSLYCSHPGHLLMEEEELETLSKFVNGRFGKGRSSDLLCMVSHESTSQMIPFHSDTLHYIGDVETG